MRAFKTEFVRRKVAIVVVSFASPESLARYQAKLNWPFPVLADPERKAYAAFALNRLSWWRVFSPATLKLYGTLMRKGMARQDYGKEDVYQSGGDFLIDPRGYLLFAHRSEDPADRPSVATLLQVIDRSPPPP